MTRTTQIAVHAEAPADISAIAEITAVAFESVAFSRHTEQYRPLTPGWRTWEIEYGPRGNYIT